MCARSPFSDSPEPSCRGGAQQWQGLAGSTSGPCSSGASHQPVTAHGPAGVSLPSPPALPFALAVRSLATPPQPWGKNRLEECQGRRQKTLREHTNSVGLHQEHHPTSASLRLRVLSGCQEMRRQETKLTAGTRSSLCFPLLQQHCSGGLIGVHVFAGPVRPLEAECPRGEPCCPASRGLRP